MKHPYRFRTFWPFVSALLVVAAASNPAFAQLPGQTPLNPRKIPQFVDALPHFAGNRVDATAGGNLYVKAVPSTQVAVSTGTKLPGGIVGITPGIGRANVWVYQISTDGTNYTPPLWPAFSIEARRGNALHVTYANELTGQGYADVGLVVDRTLHWADPLMEMHQMTPYAGEPPIVVHLHGGEVPPLSDGGPDSWFTPGNTETGLAWNPSPYYYPNTQEPATLWFHDHALGVTRLNVYAGMAGFYFLRDAAEDALRLPGFAGDDLVQEVAPKGASGVFNPTPYRPEIEIAIQDRMFDQNGSLYFPSVGINMEHPFWLPEFVGDVITVNGKTWPYLSVAPRKYRFRLLNGSNARFYELSLGNKGPAITQIGTDGGFLDAPVAIGGKLVLAPGERADVIIDFTNFVGQTFILENTARTPYPGGAPVNGNTTGRVMKFVVNGQLVDGPDGDNLAGDNSVVPPSLKSNVKLTDFAGSPAANVAVTKNRLLTLNEAMGAGGPLEVLVNNTKWNGLSLGTDVRPDFITEVDGNYYSETIQEGSTEVWRIINMTADAHPIHLHLVQFQLMSRQPYDIKAYTALYDGLFPGGGIDPMTGLPYQPGVYMGGFGPPLDYNANQTPGGPIPTVGGNPDVTPYLIGAPIGANVNEQGWKDTFIMYPGEVTTVIARWAPTDKPVTAPSNELHFPFDPSGGHGYVWHCHIIDHEDNEMMRPYNVIPSPLNPFATSLAEGSSERGQLSAEETVGVNLPASFELGQNYPNPFNPSTEIRFSLPEAARVTLTLYNSLGQEVKTLIDSDAPAGYHMVKVDGRGLSSGIYYYRIQAGSHTDVKSMVLLK